MGVTGPAGETEGGVSTDGIAEHGFTVIQPPVLELSQLFESSSENSRRNGEMLARNALFSANAKKYDILERIRFRVGGLSSELGDLVRRVLLSRQISSGILRKLGDSKSLLSILFSNFFHHALKKREEVFNFNHIFSAFQSF